MTEAPPLAFRAFSSARPLALIGAGKMGGALAAGWLGRGFDPAALVVVDPSPPPDSAAMLAGHDLAASRALPAGTRPRLLLLAVKPQAMGDALPPLAASVSPDTVVLSIAAGTTVATLDRAFPGARIVRTMPNTPAQVGRGITVAVAGPSVTAEDRAAVDALLTAVGGLEWVDDEALIDAVTAVSGSGPAYVFLLAECLAEAGVAAGLAPALAARLARETVAGAGELLYRSELPPETLRRNVTSPKGTTEAALAVLMAADGLQPLLSRAVAAAKRRSEELAG